ncbi:MAG TPA: hypothetical protein DCZ30_04645 [Clostridiales bacterium]|nr:hypothetical protein [Clostridiales bacterium]
MNTIGGQIQSQNLLRIKKIVDNDYNGDKFIIVRTKKNIDFMREYSLTNEDVKDIVRQLSVGDCFAGPEQDRNPQYKGWIFKFDPLFENTKLYIKIRIESTEKSICLSVHEFGKYDGVE